MKELEEMVEELQSYLENKVKSLGERISNSHVSDTIEHRRNEINFFKARSTEHETHPFLQQEVIQGFRKEAESIKEAIDNIK